MVATGRRVVLVGAGHAQLHTLQRAAAFTRRGHAVTLIAPEPFWYSGLATGMLGGDYPPALDRVDVEALASRAGARFIHDHAVCIDAGERLVHLAGGAGPIPYDVLSLTLGSEPTPIDGADRTPGCWRVKPISQLCALREQVEAQLRDSPQAALRLVVAGGGVTGTELAANLEALARRRGGRARVTVLAAGNRLLKQLPPGACRAVVARLQRRGIRFRTGARVDRVEPGAAVLHGGERVRFDHFVNATGLKPNPVIQASGLPVDKEGALLVDRHLRSPSHPEIHGGGDCIALQGHRLTRIGVHAIREQPVLYRNLLAAADGTEPVAFHPQDRFLWIMNLGDRTGLAVRGGHWWQGWSAWLLKDLIDRRFLWRYRPR